MKAALQILFVTIPLLTACHLGVNKPLNELETNSSVEGIEEVYDFPIKPGTPEWAKLHSHAEMVEVCQLL